MKQETVKLRAGKWLVPVTLEYHPKKIFLKFKYDRDLIDEIRAMEGRKWHPDTKRWSIARSQRNRFTLNFLQGNNVFGRYDAKLQYAASHYDVMYAHQRDMAAHIMTRRQCVIAGEMGVGKTLSVIEMLCHAQGLSPRSVWYVAPNSARISVELEFGKWKAPLWPRFMSYEGMVRILENWEGGQKPPKCIIFDESSRLKNPQTKRWQAAKFVTDEMRDEYGFAEPIIVLMSGSPAPHDPTDWWGQCELACPGFLRESSKTMLKNRLATIEMRQAPAGHMYPHLLGWKDDEIDLLSKRMEGLVIVKLKKDCLDLPEKVYKRIVLEPSEEVKRGAYLLAETAQNVLSAITLLRQLSDGFVKDGDKIEYVDTPKDKALLDILESEENRGVIYCGLTASIDKVYKILVKEKWDVIRLDGRGLKTTLGPLDKKQAIKMFASSEKKKICFLGQPGAGGMGLTLTASTWILYYSNDFNAESRIQSEDRIHRIGTKGATIIDLIHLPTDTLILDNLKKKRSMQSLSMGEIREKLEEVHA